MNPSIIGSLVVVSTENDMISVFYGNKMAERFYYRRRTYELTTASARTRAQACMMLSSRDSSRCIFSYYLATGAIFTSQPDILDLHIYNDARKKKAGFRRILMKNKTCPRYLWQVCLP